MNTATQSTVQVSGRVDDATRFAAAAYEATDAFVFIQSASQLVSAYRSLIFS